MQLDGVDLWRYGRNQCSMYCIAWRTHRKQTDKQINRQTDKQSDCNNLALQD